MLSIHRCCKECTVPTRSPKTAMVEQSVASSLSARKFVWNFFRFLSRHDYSTSPLSWRHSMKSLLFFAAVLLLGACGQRTSSLGLASSNQDQTGNRAAMDPFSYALGVSNSGTTGSPSQSGNVQSYSAVGAAYGAASSPNSSTDFWGNSTVYSATTPQQCADRYMNQQQDPSTYRRLLAELASCLNQVMLVQVRQLNQGYQTLQPYSYQASMMR